MATDIGILAAEFYCPPYLVDQSELEKYDKVSTGKYTIGLGQKRMSFCSDVEDVYSLCLTVVGRLLQRYQVEPSSIGRLEVGTETVVDKSKSIKSVLMQLFEKSGNTDIEGVDCINACYGGTQALFNAVNWVESSSWDGRLALVVMADIASYAEGPARCTGGAGAIALLIGPNAPIIFDAGLRAFDMRHVYDFYKPNPQSEYPIVDGKLSIECYSTALDNCFRMYRKKSQMKLGAIPQLNSFTGILFHAPYCKLVQKSLARLKCLELMALNQTTGNESIDKFLKICNLKSQSSTSNDESYRNVEKAFVEYSKNLFDETTQPALLMAEEIGNMYTSSLYAGLISLLINKPIEKLAGKRILLFSYGSGSCASMFSMKISQDPGSESALFHLIEDLNSVKAQLNGRKQTSPERFVEMLKWRENAFGKAPYKPIGSADDLSLATYHLCEVDHLFRRLYKLKEGGYENGDSKRASNNGTSVLHG